MTRTCFASTAICLLFCLFANGAFAQYVWLDEKGVRQFSDMPPPASVPQGRILKQPGGAPAKAAPSSSDEPAGSEAKPASAPPKGPLTAAEQNAEFKKRRAEQAEKEKKAAEQAKREADKATNCERARNYQRSLESGERLTQLDQNGEHTFMSDEQRERDLQESRRTLADCK